MPLRKDQGAIELLLNDEENKEATTYHIDFEEKYFKIVLMSKDLMYKRKNEEIQNQDNVDIMVSNETSNIVV